MHLAERRDADGAAKHTAHTGSDQSGTSNDRDGKGNRDLLRQKGLHGVELQFVVQAGEEGIRFLLVSGKPLEEPVAWYGPIVMNTQEQLQQAFKDLEKGTFLKGHK